MNLNKISFYGEVQNGKLLPQSTREEIALFFSTLKGNVRITIEQAKRFRSLDQNRLYWRILTIIAHETSHTTKELHEAFKIMFLPRTFVRIGKNEIAIPKSTTVLFPSEFKEYIYQICAQAAEMDIVVTLPGEVPLAAYADAV